MRKKAPHSTIRPFLLILGGGLFFLGFLFFSRIWKQHWRIKTLPQNGKTEGVLPVLDPKQVPSKETSLGIPIVEGKQRKKEEGLLALKILNGSGFPAKKVLIKFLRIQNLQIGKGWTDGKGEFYVFQEGTYVFQVGGRMFVRKLIPPLEVLETNKNLPKIIRLKQGGRLRVHLTVFPGSRPYLKSKGLLFIDPPPSKRISLNWRQQGPFTNQNVLDFIKESLKPTPSPEKGKKKPSLKQSEYSILLKKFMSWARISHQQWIPYTTKDFFLRNPTPQGYLIWEGLPEDLPLRWGLEKTGIPIEFQHPFEAKEIQQKKKKDGANVFTYMGRKPKDLSGLVRIVSKETTKCQAKVFTGNGVIASIPVPKDWRFQKPPILLSLTKKGDRFHGGSMETWNGEKEGVPMKGRYIFQDLLINQEKEVYCWIRNKSATKFQLLRSGPFLFKGGWKDIGSLTPLSGEDSVLSVLVDGKKNDKDIKKIFPLNRWVTIASFPMGEIKVFINRPITFLGARNQSVSFWRNPNKDSFSNTITHWKKNWRFIKTNTNEIDPDFGHLKNLPPQIFFHLRPIRRRTLFLSARVVEGKTPSGGNGAIEFQAYPNQDFSFIHKAINTKKLYRDIQASMEEDVENPHKIVTARLQFQGRLPRGQNRLFFGFSTQPGPHIFLPLKPALPIQVVGLPKNNSMYVYFLQHKELFEKKIPLQAGTASDFVEKNGTISTRVPLPLPGDYVLFKSLGDKTIRIKDFHISPTNPVIVLR